MLRLGRMLDDLGERGIEQLLLDCSQVRHIDYRTVPAAGGGARRASRAARAAPWSAACSAYLRDLFRLGGCEARLRCWPSAADLLAAPAGTESGREYAS